MRMIRDIAACLLAYAIAGCARWVVSGSTFGTSSEPAFRGLAVLSMITLVTVLLWRAADRLRGRAAMLLSVTAPFLALAAFLGAAQLDHWLHGRLLSQLPSASRAVIFGWVGLLAISWGWLRLFRHHPSRNAEPIG